MDFNNFERDHNINIQNFKYDHKNMFESFKRESEKEFENRIIEHHTNSFNFEPEQSYNEILFIRTINFITLIGGIFILFFGYRKIKLTSGFLVYSLLVVFKSSHYISTSANLTGFDSYYIDLIDYLIVLPCLSAIFYRYPKPIIYLLSLLTGIHTSIFFNPIQAYIPQLAFLLFWSAILFALYQTYHRMDKMVIISTSYTGAMLFVSNFIAFLNFDLIEKYGLKSKDFYGVLTRTLIVLGLTAFGAWYQFKNYYKSKANSGENNIKRD